MARVLVVDDDPWNQRMVSAILAQGGHLVDLASDGWEALIRAGRRRPDVVITQLKLPTTDGWSLAEAMRSRPGADAVRFVFLASMRSERTPGPSFRPATDHLVLKPFRLEQVEAAVTATLNGGGAQPGSPTEPIDETTTGQAVLPTARAPGAGATIGPLRAVLTGSLEEFGLSSVLIVLELERKSGVVVLHAEGGVGRLHLREGRVIRAQIEATGARGASLAVFEMLAWSHGRFEFQSGVVEGEDEIGASTSFLLLEGARLQDERTQAQAKDDN
jgi:DNA-binding response OmpR family regulator